MPRCSTSIRLHSAGGALERPTARTRYTYITYHTTLHYIPHDENTAAGRPRAGGRRRGTRWPAIGGGALVTTKNKRSNQKQINSQNAMLYKTFNRPTNPSSDIGGRPKGSPITYAKTCGIVKDFPHAVCGLATSYAHG